MSRGSGRLMQRILEILRRAPGREMTRKDLDDLLVAEGFFPQNTLRAVRSLARRHLVSFKDGSSRETSVVRLPREIQILSDYEIGEILKQLGGRK